MGVPTASGQSLDGEKLVLLIHAGVLFRCCTTSSELPFF